MKEHKILVNALNNNYKGSYNRFETYIVNFMEEYMKSLCDSEYYFPSCIIKSNIEVAGITIGTDRIILNKIIINELMKGDKTVLLVLFHELTHIQ